MRALVKRVGALASVALLVSLVSLAISPVTAFAAGLCVNQEGTNGCYSSIQAAVNDAPSGSAIMVHSGTYYEHVMITKPVSLHAEGVVTIDASGELNGITVDGVDSANPSVFIKGFTVENANLSGVLISNSSHVLLFNNTIQNNDKGLVLPTDPNGEPSCPDSPYPLLAFDCGEGVNLNGASYSVLYHNLVQGNFGGILLSDELGPTHDNVVLRNQVLNNGGECGITMASHPAGTGFDENGAPLPGNGVYNNQISYNVSSGNGGAGVGVFASTPGTGAYDNTVYGNDITNNGMPGITVHSHAPDQNANGNRFLFNTLSGNGWFGDPDVGLVPAPIGIEIFADASEGAAPLTDTLVYGNRITNQDVGVMVGTTAIDSSFHVNRNWLGDTTIGVQNVGSGTLDATMNYWGCAAGPTSPDCAGVIGDVNYTPWIP